MGRRNTPFPPHSTLLNTHPRVVRQPAQQLPAPTTLPWREMTEIWLIPVVVALAAIFAGPIL